MADIERKATGVWNGDLRSGNGKLTTGSSTLNDTQYNFNGRFAEGTGTNPEELLAASHAGCYSMALGNSLSSKGFKVNSIDTTATVVLTTGGAGGTAITKIKLHTKGQVEGIDDAAFQAAAEETKANCIISKALSAVPMELVAELAGETVS